MEGGVLLFGNAVVSIVIIGFVLQGCLCTQKQDSLFKFKLQVLVLNNNVTSGKAVGTSYTMTQNCAKVT